MTAQTSAAALGRNCRDGVAGAELSRAPILSPAIVHFGVGNFHRAHQAVYLDDLFNLGREPRLGDRRRRRARGRRRHALGAAGAGLADHRRRAGGASVAARASPAR